MYVNTENREFLLAFDLSSVTIGYSLFDINTQELVRIDYYKYKNEDLLDKGREIEDLFLSLTREYNVTDFVIEERLKKFAGGRSSINILLTLAQLNYICQYIVKYKTTVKLSEIGVLKARKLLFPTIFKETRATKEKQKDYVFGKVLGMLDNSLFPTKVMKSGARKGEKVFLEEAKDMADSFAIGTAWFKLK